MAYQFPPDIEKGVQALMATGDYENEDDLLRDAVRILKHRREDVESIDRGFADIEAGRCRPADQADAEFEKKYSIPPD